MTENQYKQYCNEWLSGLPDEIYFWEKFMKEQGGVFFYQFAKTVDKDRQFELEEDIPIGMYGGEYKFLDVGSGPFSRCGKVTNKVKMDALSVDPLAGAYTILKKKYQIDNGLRLETGFVEFLDKKFSQNTFDMVHMSNSLDHCFDALYGIYEMLYVCKIGGKVILRHAENEGEREKYKGLHQWNLSLKNKENAFIIWREDKRFNVCEIFGEYADIELYTDLAEGVWIYNKVVMTKRKDITLPENNYYSCLFEYIYDNMIKMLVEHTIVNELKPNEIICQKIRDIYNNNPECFAEKLHYLGIEKVTIYGMGIVGKSLYHLLLRCGIEIVDIIDQEDLIYGGKRTIRLDESQIEGDVTVIITIHNDYMSIYHNIIDMGIDKKMIVQIDELLV